MSVLSCDRNSCENIMCSHLILDSTAYLCDDCYFELIVYKESWQTNVPTYKVTIRKKIEEFMETTPGTYVVLNGDEIDEEFKRLCGNRRD